MKRLITLIAITYSFMALALATDYDVLYNTSFTSDAADSAYTSGNLDAHKDWEKANNPGAYLVDGASGTITSNTATNWRGARLVAAPIVPWVVGTSIRVTFDMALTAVNLNGGAHEEYIGVTHTTDGKELVSAGKMTGIKIVPQTNTGAMLFKLLDGDSIAATTDAQTPLGSMNSYELMITKSETADQFDISITLVGDGMTASIIGSGTVTNADAYAAPSLVFALYNKKPQSVYAYHSLKLEQEALDFIPLIANPGSDQTVLGATEVTLAGSSNYDGNTDYTLTHQWYSADGVTLTNDNTSTASFTAESTTSVKVYSFGYKVTASENGGSGFYEDSATVMVTINPEGGLYAGGSGTDSLPYQIANADHLFNLAMTPGDWGKSFAQTASIDMAGVDFMPIGDGGEKFTGNYDGQRFTISNLSIMSKKGETSTGGGLFGDATGSLSNIGLINPSILMPGKERVGGIVGNLTGTVNNCFVQGGIVKSGKGRVGGVVGASQSGKISNVYATCEVVDTIQAEGASTTVGGIIGQLGWDKDWASGASLTNAVFNGTIAGNGVIGMMYSMGAVPVSIEGAYYIEGSADSLAFGTAMIMTADALTEASYVGFDFENVWSISTEDACAVLQGFDHETSALKSTEQSAFNIYPNPASDLLIMSEMVKVASVYTINGVLLKSATNTKQINVSDLGAGVYFLRADQKIIKFVKQ